MAYLGYLPERAKDRQLRLKGINLDTRGRTLAVFFVARTGPGGGGATAYRVAAGIPGVAPGEDLVLPLDLEAAGVPPGRYDVEVRSEPFEPENVVLAYRDARGRTYEAEVAPLRSL